MHLSWKRKKVSLLSISTFLDDISILSTFTTREYKSIRTFDFVSISESLFFSSIFPPHSSISDFLFSKVSFFLSFPHIWKRYKTIRRWYLTSCKKQTVYDYDVAFTTHYDYDVEDGTWISRRVLILVLR